MSSRYDSVLREAERFMPWLWDFCYPAGGRRYGPLQRVALRVYIAAFRLRCKLLKL